MFRKENVHIQYWIEIIQEKLFQKRLGSASKITTPPWTMGELDKVLSSLKTGKSCDPSGLISDIFKPPICGTDLKISILVLLNKTKETLLIPQFLPIPIFLVYGRKKEIS